MKLGFRLRITLTIVAVAFLCVITALFINYHDAKKMLESNYVQSLDEKLTIQAERFDEIMHEMYQEIRRITHSTELRTQIQEYLSNERTYTDSMAMSRKLDELLTFRQLDSAIYLYLPQCQRIFSSVEYYAVCNVAKKEIPLWATESGNPFIPLYFTTQFARSSQRVYAYSHTVYSETGAILGVLCIVIDERQLYYNLLDSMNTEDKNVYRILSPDGVICSSQNVSEIGNTIPVLSHPQENRMNAEVVNGINLYISVESSFSRYRLQCQSNLSNLTAALRTRLLYLIMASILIVIILIYVAQEMSIRLSQPMNELIAAIDQVSVGDFTARAHSKTEDEFDTLREHFNHMVSHMDELMNEIVRERTYKKEAELNALQYQIRPHFMYNTLNSIRFAAVLQHNQKLSELLGSFIALLEASAQRNGAFIPLCDEIKLVKDYLSLQAFRYFDCFEAVYQIAPETEDCFVPCLLLQPMVENAVFHGVNTKQNDNRIEIAAWIKEKFLFISVTDNGKGMQSKTDPDADPTQDKRRFTGIGLRNVEQRLRLYYGDAADFTINSQINVGTTVLFRLPVSHHPDEYAI